MATALPAIPPITSRLLATLLALALCAASLWAAAAPDQRQVQNKEAELEKLRQVIKDTNSQLNALRSRYDDLRVQRREVERAIGGINDSLRELEQQRREQTDALARLQQDKRRKEAGLAQQRQTLAEHLRASYALGQQGPVKLLLNQTEPAAAGRSLKYYEYFHRARTTQIDAINRTLLAVARLEQDIQSQGRVLDDLLTRQQTQKAALEDKRLERKTLLSRLESEISNSQQRLSRLKEDEQGLQELVGRLRRALAEMPPPALTGKGFAKLKGQLKLPTEGKIAARYGSPRQLGHLKWQGIVIDAPEGTEVRAIAPGRVVFADWMRGFGLLLILDHGDGYMSLYGYNQALNKNVGDVVEARALIARSGIGEARERPGLYFEIRQQGTPVNPLTWCKAP
ncbi:MAG: peptidoglycan DD-metalloendopeptidase family protein [Pseudomonadota bacterium]